MKNLYIYINPAKQFTNTDWGSETETLVKIQIDNSLALGWKVEDIVLVTNFDYEYRGVRAIVVSDDLYCTHSSGTPSKINVIVDMFEKGLIADDLYWFHDFDAFQLEPITPEEIGITDGQIALTDYGYTCGRPEILSRWSTGSVFFNKGSKEVFDWIKIAVYKYMANEEVSLLALTRHNKHGICERVKKLNLTYNLAIRRRDVGLSLGLCEKPLKVLHFHPFDKRITSLGKNALAVCMYGRCLDKPLMPERLIEIFKQYGIQ